MVGQVRYLEAVDVMARQLVARLAAAEAAGRGRFAVCVTGDHSTPVVFGDHSHEPVPLALAHIRRACALSCTMMLGRGVGASSAAQMPCGLQGATWGVKLQHALHGCLSGRPRTRQC